MQLPLVRKSISVVATTGAAVVNSNTAMESSSFLARLIRILLITRIYTFVGNIITATQAEINQKYYCIGIFITTSQVLQIGRALIIVGMKQDAGAASEEAKRRIQRLFGSNVQKYRKIAGLTQEQLSERLEISQKHLSIIETGTQFASAALIGRLAETLGVTPADLFGGTGTDELKKQTSHITATLMTFLANELNRMRALLRHDMEELLAAR